jgi:cysteine desulfuration protein SufE
MADIAQIIDDFEYLDEWDDRYRYVIELGEALPPMAESDRTDSNKVQGCVSQVWLVREPETGDPADPVLRFRGDSDAHIVRGLVAITLAAMSGRPASEIETFDAVSLFTRLRLIENLSRQRANGLRSMIARIKSEAASAKAA